MNKVIHSSAQSHRGRPRQSSQVSAPAKSLDKALVVLCALAEADSVSLNDLSLDLGIPSATLLRFLQTFERRGFVSQSRTDATWSIGIEAFRVGSAFPRAAKLLNLARPVLKDLAQGCGETANLGVLDQQEVIFIAQHETHHAIRAFFRPGSRSPWHASGIGQAVMAYSSALEQQTAFSLGVLERYTPNTRVAKADVLNEFSDIRQRGYAIDDEERFMGMRCLAAPIFNANNEVIAGISISGPVARVTPQCMVQVGERVAEAGRSLSRALGSSRFE